MTKRHVILVVMLISSVLTPRWGVGAQLPDAPSQFGSSGASGLLIVENVGQFAAGARYQLWGGPAGTWLTEDGLWLTLAQPTRSPSTAAPAVHLHLSFTGANAHPRLEPFARAETAVSYLIGADPDGWHTSVPVWHGVRYVGLYPGVDLVVEANADAASWLPWRLEAGSSAALEQVRLRVEGATGVALERAALAIETQVGSLRVPLLTLGRSVGEIAPDVQGSGAGFEVRAPFAPATVAQDAHTPLSDRPADLLYATLLGGSEGDAGYSMAVDSQGRAFIVGYTSSSNFPASSGPGYDTTANGNWDAYVVKLNAAGTAIVYATFLGGSRMDNALGVALDTAGCAYVVGLTLSDNFPARTGPGYDTSYNGGAGDAYLLKLNAAGTGLVYGTYLGGGGGETAYGLALDGARCAYVVGYTESEDFPGHLAPGYDREHDGWGVDGFAVKVSANGRALVYGTYLGGVYNKDYCRAVAVDAAGCAYITGDTRSQDFPAALGPGYDTALGGAQDAFVVKLSADGKSLPYATFIGGGSGEIGYAVDLDNAGCAYIAGETSSSDLLAAGVAGYDKTLGGESDAFVVKLNAAGRALVYGTLLGGGSTEVASGLAVDAAGRACLVGETSSTDYPTGPGFDTSFNGASGSDCFVSQLSVSGTALLYGSYLGSNWNDTAAAVALDGASCAYLTGAWPEAALPGAGVPGYDKTPNGTWDAFAAKLRLGEAVQSPRVRLPVVWR